MEKEIKLYGKVFFIGDIKVITGLTIGSGDEGISIGGVDKLIIRNPINGKPYIPGSSIRGKMRSLLERAENLTQNYKIQDIYIHLCNAKDNDEKDNDKNKYEECDVCQIFGISGENKFAKPTRLIIRDVTFNEDSLPIEVKWEATIDRVTSAAVPRSMQRVPEGTVFKGFEFCYSVYEEKDLLRLKKLFKAMQLLEDDYLGGSGSRGSGKIKFEKIAVECRPVNDYGNKNGRKKYNESDAPMCSLEKLLEKQDCIINWLAKELKLRGENNEDNCIQAQP